MNQDKNIRNSQGQDVQEPGKYSENEYLPDCPFLLGRQQVEWFKHFQRERDEHTITSVDDFLKSARKDPKPLKESFTSNVINKAKSASQEEKRQIVTNIQFEDPEVERICHEHGVYTIADAVKVTSINKLECTSWFSDENIETFNEFKYFTGLKKVNRYSFTRCENLKSITLPDNIKCIEKYAFYYCKSLKNINIPDRVTSIGEDAFYECESLESINLPDRLSNIERAAFANCSSLLSIKIPNRITVISKALFSNCKYLHSVILPDNLKIIESFAFCACSFLKSITLPNTVTFIGESAFEDCVDLKSINIPDSVKVIKDFVFEDLSIIKIYISKNHPLRKKLKEDYPSLKLYLPTKNVNESFTSNVIKKTKEKTQKDKREELFKYVNLGLPSGNLWCKHNYGAKKEEENGKYYNFNEAISLYLNNESLPSKYDFIELDRYCSHKWTKINGTKGMLFTSNENGNSIFFPGVGYEDGADGYIANFNRNGYYWSSSSYVDYYQSYDLAINDDNKVYPEDISSYSYRFPIRTIRKTNHIKESFTNNVIKKSKETSQEDKRNITLTVEGLASQIERINTNKDIEIVRFPIYLKDSPNNEIIGYDLLIKCFRNEFVDTMNGKKIIETGQHRMSILFRFVLNEGEYSLAIGYLSDETYRKTYSLPNINTSKPLISKKIDMINLIYGNVYSKMIEKYSKEEFKRLVDMWENIIKSIQIPDYTKEFNNGYPSTNIPSGFLIKQENIIPYVKECYNIFLEIIEFDNKELSLYKHIEEIFEKKNITII